LKSLYTFVLAFFEQQFIPTLAKASAVMGNGKTKQNNNKQ
jgi:hypothetical protein